MDDDLHTLQESTNDLCMDGRFVAMARCTDIKQEPIDADCEDEPFVDMGGFLELETVVKNESTFETEQKNTEEAVPSRRQVDKLEAVGNAKQLIGRDKSSLETEGEGNQGVSIAPQKCFSVSSHIPKNRTVSLTSSEPYTCLLCDGEFPSNVELRDHNFAFHSTEKQSTCSFCGNLFVSLLDFTKHLSTHLTSQCRICLKVFTTKNEKRMECKQCTVALEHSKSSKKRTTDNTVKEFQCRVCEMTCTSYNNLKRHVKLHRQDIIQCPICGKTFTEKHTLNQHLKLHSGSRPFKCETCDLTFTRASHLKQHRNTHTGIRAYECATCTKSFTLKSSLIRHMTTHRLSSDDRRFMCEVCGKAFKQSATLKSHTFVHSGGAKPYICDSCGKCFARMGSLQVHTRSHAGVRRFSCGMCSKTFTTNGKLTIHTRNHTGSRPYRCEKCNRTFNQSSALKQHSWTHSGFRPLQCPLCCKGFIRKIRLTDHLKQCGK